MRGSSWWCMMAPGLSNTSNSAPPLATPCCHASRACNITTVIPLLSSVAATQAWQNLLDRGNSSGDAHRTQVEKAALAVSAQKRWGKTPSKQLKSILCHIFIRSSDAASLHRSVGCCTRNSQRDVASIGTPTCQRVLRWWPSFISSRRNVIAGHVAEVRTWSRTSLARAAAPQPVWRTSTMTRRQRRMRWTATSTRRTRRCCATLASMTS